MYKPSYNHATYMRYTLRTPELRKTIKLAKKALKDLDFDAIAFRGNSGALFAGPLAIAMNKSLILVRKSTRNCHSDQIVEGDEAAKNYIIADEFISCGETVRTIVKEIKKFAPKAVCLGVVEARQFGEEYKKNTELARCEGRLYTPGGLTRLLPTFFDDFSKSNES